MLKLTFALLGAYLLAGLVARLGVTGFAAGARVGLAVGLISVTLSFDSAQAGQPLGLILTDGIFMVLVASLMGAVLAKAHGQQRGEEK